ncbi:MAG: type IV secretion system protein [Vicinamibacteraceae bacterium]
MLGDAPFPQIELFSEIQRAITALLTTYEPEFIRFGYTLFLAFATILISWHGIRMMLTHEPLGEHLFGFAKLLVFISLGYALIVYYESPLPGIGVSASNLITDQAHYFAHILDAKAVERTYAHLDDLWLRFMQPDAWAILPNLQYWLLFIVLAIAKILSIAVIAFGLIATAVCGLLGPLFVPFLLAPTLDWLFWGWLKSYVQYAFIEVVAFAFFMIFERFIFAYVTMVPPGITEGDYPLYHLQALVVVGAFAIGVLLIPSLTSSLFSGRGGESILPAHFVRF